MNKKTIITCVISTLALTFVMYFGKEYIVSLNAPIEPEKIVEEEQEKPVTPPIEIKIGGTPSKDIPKNPEVVITEDKDGNQEIKPIISKEPVEPAPQPTPAPSFKPEPEVKPTPEVKPEVKPEPKPETKPQPKPEVKPQPKPKPEVKPSEPKFGESRVVDGKAQTYFPGEGWVTDQPGGTSEYIEVRSNGNLIGY